MTDETVISAKSLDLTFQTNDGPVHALKDVNLDIKKGECLFYICSGVQSIEHPNVLREKINFTAHGSAN